MVTEENFRSLIVAQDDDNDYSESGWLALVDDGIAYLAQYGHCSCYGTWESLCGRERDLPANWYVWFGTRRELLDMAKRKADPAVPERASQPGDNDYDHLMVVYEEVLNNEHKICPENFV